ncbi:hypothetical protein ACSBR1_029735 [Camellia fascicularis]
MHQALTFTQLVDGTCGKFDGMVPEMEFLLFAIASYNKFKVECDEDVQNMLSLAKSFGLDHIDVLVQKCDVIIGGGSSRSGCSGEREGESSPIPGKMFDMDHQTDLLPPYCPHRSKLYLSRFNSLHMCGAAVRTSRNSCTGSNLVADVVADRVCAQPLTRPNDIIFYLKNDYGLDVSYRVAWHGVEKARGEVYRDYVVSFNQLKWYSDAVLENNPNSYTNLDFE